MNLELFNMEPRYASRHLNFSDWYHCEVPLHASRVLWDGGVTRGQKTPWDSGDFPATGMYDSRGYTVSLPDAFLNQLPCTPLDGYLYDTPEGLQLGVVGLPPGTRMFKTGERIAGDRIITVDPGLLRSCISDNPYSSEWVSLPGGDTAAAFGYELFRMEYMVSGTSCHVMPFRKTDDLDVHTRIAMGKRLFLRHEASAWCTSFSPLCATTDYIVQSEVAVIKVLNDIVYTDLGTYRQNDDPQVKRHDVISVFLNAYGFITGYHAT
jgi:hypothetical protein